MKNAEALADELEANVNHLAVGALLEGFVALQTRTPNVGLADTIYALAAILAEIVTSPKAVGTGRDILEAYTEVTLRLIRKRGGKASA